MDTGRIYHDSEGNERTIHQMIKLEPYWAANRLQEGERAIERLKELEEDKSCALYVDYRKSCQALKKHQAEMNK